MLNSVISSRYKSYIVKSLSGEGYVKGKRTKTYSTQTLSLTILPVSLKDIKESPEGVYAMGDIKIYVAGAKTIPAKSIVTFQDDDYNIKELIYRQYGDYSLYVGKVINK